jgi:long-subunit acyl-CoA synthetase (AMP-forming)
VEKVFVTTLTFFRKLVLGKYLWRSFDDFANEATRVGLGFAKLGLKSKSKIAFLAETRAEWISKCLLFS